MLPLSVDRWFERRMEAFYRLDRWGRPPFPLEMNPPMKRP